MQPRIQRRIFQMPEGDGREKEEEGKEVGKDMPDQDGYPSDDELQKVKHWDSIGDPHGLVDFLEEIWHWPDWGIYREEGKTECSEKRCLNLFLSTGGWSGNESIIGTLQSNFFWALFWKSSRRGGHYEFEIPLDWGKK